MEAKILTLHPQGKSGVNISKASYEVVRAAIIAALEQEKELTFGDLGLAVKRQLEGKFDGSVSWYYTTVKLDLEARGIIEQIGRGSPMRLRLSSSDS